MQLSIKQVQNNLTSRKRKCKWNAKINHPHVSMCIYMKIFARMAHKILLYKGNYIYM